MAAESRKNTNPGRARRVTRTHPPRLPHGEVEGDEGGGDIGGGRQAGLQLSLLTAAVRPRQALAAAFLHWLMKA